MTNKLDIIIILPIIFHRFFKFDQILKDLQQYSAAPGGVDSQSRGSGVRFPASPSFLLFYLIFFSFSVSKWEDLHFLRFYQLRLLISIDERSDSNEDT